MLQSLPLFPLITVFVVIVVASLLPSRVNQKKKKPKQSEQVPSEIRPDPIERVGSVRWGLKPLMNSSEYKIFSQLEQFADQSPHCPRVFSQVSMGEILRIDDKAADRSAKISALNSVNAKRVDFLITDIGGMPIVALEYHGAGHFRGNAKVRDAVKREAFRLAGLPFIEVSEAGFNPDQIATLTQILDVPEHASAA